MTRQRQTKPKPDPVLPTGPRPKKVSGVLACDRCKRAIPYQGYEDPVWGSEPWPQHRCGLEVRDFTRFELEDPFRPPLAKMDSRGNLYPEGWL